MLSPGAGPATHAVWGAGLVRPRPSHSAARYRDYALVSTGPGCVAAHHDAGHQLSREFAAAARAHAPDRWRVLGARRSFGGGLRGRALGRESAAQPAN